MSISDDFNRANGGLGANWTTGMGTAPQIVSNAAKGQDGGYSSAYYTGSSWNANQSSQVVRGASNYSGPVVRGSGNSFYLWHTGNELQKIISGVASTIAVLSSGANGDTMKLVITGTTLEAFLNGVSQGTWTDSALSSGSPGIGFFGTAGTVDDWVGTGEAAAVLDIATTSLPNGTTGTAYSQSLSATGGTAPYTWSILSGSLPAGLTLSGDTISGTPTTAGTASFTVRVTDNVAATDDQALSITIALPQLSDPLTRLNGGDAFLKNASYLGDADGTAEPDWDKCGPAAIVKVGAGDYRCWYEGVSPIKTLDPTNQTGSFDYNVVTCYATSSDGLTWTKRDNNSNGITDTILSVAITPTNPAGGSLAWMRGESSPGSVLYDPDAGLWKMWGHGGNNTGPRAIFYATSSDGLSWTLQNNGQPVLQKSASGWDGLWVADPRVIRLSATSYLMLYRGTPSTGRQQIGLATSSDGITWTKYGSNPVIASGASGAWDDQAIYPAGVIVANGALHCWYGGDENGDTGGTGLGYATSTDNGQTWTKGANNPVLTRSASGLDSDSMGDTIGAYIDGSRVRVHWGSEKTSGSPQFRGRMQADVGGVTLAKPLFHRSARFVRRSF